eukprot:8222821-Ditylum_brightwellii.AAC.1
MGPGSKYGHIINISSVGSSIQKCNCTTKIILQQCMKWNFMTEKSRNFEGLTITMMEGIINHAKYK